MMWETAYKKLLDQGHEINLSSRVSEISKDDDHYLVTTKEGEIYRAKNILSSMPLAHLPKTIRPEPVDSVKTSGENLKFRDFLSVALVINEEDAFPDNWIYIHEPDVKVGRVQNYGSWSPYMVKEGKTCLGLEYFVNIGDELWSMDDENLISLATEELEKLSLIKKNSTLEGYVVRMPKAYPVYDLNYSTNISNIEDWLSKDHSSIYPIGRNGMHRYNNQDHSMMTAVKSVRNILLGETNDIWKINVEDDYLEEINTGRSAPIKKE